VTSEGFDELPRLLGHEPRIDSDAGRTQKLKPAAGDPGIRIDARGDDPPYA
jgi:hypothetical protein